MPHPFQCVAYTKFENDGVGVLLAACGSRLLSVSLSQSAITSCWSAANTQAAKPDASLIGDGDDDAEHPKKKQKTEATAPGSLNIIKLATSPDGKHAVIVTEDKHVRVLSLEHNTLSELSERILPKRPCAVQVLPDNKTIVVGDKFGDVYSLPLLPSAEADAAAAAAEAEKQAAKTFKPSASNLTVHSKRNLESLQSQMNQKKFTPRKEALAFVHQLLLGHVSMLTDALFVQIQAPQVDRTRGYIFTADRDEHIRVSRGPPQSHIIEGFCLGHTNFVSKLCLAGQDTLVSGGGDDWIGVWDWRTFSLKCKVDIKTAVARALAADGKLTDDIQVAVSNLLAVPIVTEGRRSEIIVFACEGVNALFSFDSSSLPGKEGEKAEINTLQLGAQPIDLQKLSDDSACLVASLDEREEGSFGLRAYSIVFTPEAECAKFSLAPRKDVESKLQALREATSDLQTDGKKTDDLLYGVANLRKRAGWDQDNEG